MGRIAVLDANLTLGLFLPLPYTDAVYRLVENLHHAQADLYAPCLWEYECLSGLRRAVSQGYICSEDALQILRDLLALEIARVPPGLALHESALRWAERLGQNKAYDAHYVALAEQLEAEFWSADQHLVHAMRNHGIPWTRWIGEIE